MSSVFGRTARTHRVPILLLTLLVGTLLLPRACDETRVAVGAWLPATVAPERTAPAALPQEERARLLAEIERLHEELGSRPAGAAALAGVPLTSRARSAPVSGLSARVLHRETSTVRRSFVIDVGRGDGVQPGHPVVQKDSLVGIVVTAASGAARALRIDDRGAATSLPAVVLCAEADAASPCRGTGVARGTGDGFLRLSYLAAGGARVGDLVVTGAGSRLVPEGLLLGEVVECGDADRDGAFDAVVRPLRDLDAVASVWVLRTEAPGLQVEAR
jgi:hypothetical protein